MVKLDILSDPICPWCYIGKAYLDRALTAHPDHAFEIEWHPFQLNPDMPADGMDRRAYMEAKFGGQEGAVKAYTPVQEHAEQAGLELDFAGIKRTPNTLDAHRLIHWAGLEGRQTAMVSALFAAYFKEGRDIGDKEELVEIADSIGLDKSIIAHLLSTDADADEIEQRDTHGRERGVTGVPCFIIANQHVLSGAQPPELWGKVIDEIAGQLENSEADDAAE